MNFIQAISELVRNGKAHIVIGVIITDLYFQPTISIICLSFLNHLSGSAMHSVLSGTSSVTVEPAAVYA